MKLSINIGDKLSAVFEDICKEDGISKQDLLRRSLMTYAVLSREVSKGSRLILRNGEEEKEIALTF
jgi:hypothetical protein